MRSSPSSHQQTIIESSHRLAMVFGAANTSHSIHKAGIGSGQPINNNFPFILTDWHSGLASRQLNISIEIDWPWLSAQPTISSFPQKFSRDLSSRKIHFIIQTGWPWYSARQHIINWFRLVALDLAWSGQSGLGSATSVNSIAQAGLLGT